MYEYSLNPQLYCLGCNCPRSLYQYTITQSGYRSITCIPCHERQALIYASQSKFMVLQVSYRLYRCLTGLTTILQATFHI
jgi:hypothetical protein